MKDIKFKNASFNNRKKQITVTYTSGKRIQFHFGQVGIGKQIRRAWIDPETAHQSVGFEFTDGTRDFLPYDQPLAIDKDPQFLLQTHIEILTARIKEELKRKQISKRYLAERLQTSDNQVQRLLNPKILNKNLEQLYKVASLLNLQFELRLEEAA